MATLFESLRNGNKMTINNITIDVIKVSLYYSPTCNLDEEFEVVFVNTEIESQQSRDFIIPSEDGLYKFIIENDNIKEFIYAPQYNVLLESLIEDVDYVLCNCDCEDCEDCDGEGKDLLTVVLKLMAYNIINQDRYSQTLMTAHECISCDILEASNCNLLSGNVIGNIDNTNLLKKLIAFYYVCYYFTDIQVYKDVELVKNMYKFPKIYPCAKKYEIDIECIENADWESVFGQSCDCTLIENRLTQLEDSVIQLDTKISDLTTMVEEMLNRN